jgi:hypothetical protein
MRLSLFGMALFGLVVTNPPTPKQNPAAFKWEDRWSSRVVPVMAPLSYEDQCLIVSSRDGVAIVAFPKEVEFGVKYTFRCWDLTVEKERSGEGQLFDKPGSTMKAETLVRAGPLVIDWSYSGPGKGWVYWWPEAGTTVQFARLVDYHRLDFKRFVRP